MEGFLRFWMRQNLSDSRLARFLPQKSDVARLDAMKFGIGARRWGPLLFPPWQPGGRRALHFGRGQPTLSLSKGAQSYGSNEEERDWARHGRGFGWAMIERRGQSVLWVAPGGDVEIPGPVMCQVRRTTKREGGRSMTQRIARDIRGLRLVIADPAGSRRGSGCRRPTSRCRPR